MNNIDRLEMTENIETILENSHADRRRYATPSNRI